ncbi:MAG: hypothetical protein VB878_11840 [Pirellulaceae bacterium]
MVHRSQGNKKKYREWLTEKNRDKPPSPLCALRDMMGEELVRGLDGKN